MPFTSALKKESWPGSYKTGRNSCESSFLIVDAQSVKNTDSAQDKGSDAGKKICGIKRHIAVDRQGLPYAFAITAANVTDRSGSLLVFEENKDELTEERRFM